MKPVPRDERSREETTVLLDGASLLRRLDVRCISRANRRNLADRVKGGAFTWYLRMFRGTLNPGVNLINAVYRAPIKASRRTNRLRSFYEDISEPRVYTHLDIPDGNVINAISTGDNLVVSHAESMLMFYCNLVKK